MENPHASFKVIVETPEPPHKSRALEELLEPFMGTHLADWVPGGRYLGSLVMKDKYLKNRQDEVAFRLNPDPSFYLSDNSCDSLLKKALGVVETRDFWKKRNLMLVNENIHGISIKWGLPEEEILDIHRQAFSVIRKKIVEFGSGPEGVDMYLEYMNNLPEGHIVKKATDMVWGTEKGDYSLMFLLSSGFLDPYEWATSKEQVEFKFHAFCAHTGHWFSQSNIRVEEGKAISGGIDPMWDKVSKDLIDSVPDSHWLTIVEGQI